MRRAFAILFCTLVLLVCASQAEAEDVVKDTTHPQVAAVSPSHQVSAPARENSADPFLAATMGMLPFVSGFYVSDAPAKGLVFSLVDGLLVLGVYTSRYTEQGNPNNVRNYFLLMGANNLLDAFLSARDATRNRAPRSQVALRPDGGLHYALQWRF